MTVTVISRLAVDTPATAYAAINGNAILSVSAVFSGEHILSFAAACHLPSTLGDTANYEPSVR
jgi:hypothetical protein